MYLRYHVGGYERRTLREALDFILIAGEPNGVLGALGSTNAVPPRADHGPRDCRLRGASEIVIRCIGA